jgi:phosphocarrier protein
VPDRHAVKLTIRNRLGLHARPAMSLVDTASAFPCDVRVRRGDDEVDGKSIMELMMLAATCGTELEISAAGDKAADCLAAIIELVNRGFDEE